MTRRKPTISLASRASDNHRNRPESCAGRMRSTGDELQIDHAEGRLEMVEQTMTYESLDATFARRPHHGATAASLTFRTVAAARNTAYVVGWLSKV